MNKDYFSYLLIIAFGFAVGISAYTISKDKQQPIKKERKVGRAPAIIDFEIEGCEGNHKEFGLEECPKEE